MAATRVLAVGLVLLAIGCEPKTESEEDAGWESFDASLAADSGGRVPDAGEDRPDASDRGDAAIPLEDAGGPQTGPCSVCTRSATCDESAAEVSCACPSGFRGDGRIAGTGCSDVNECTDGTAGCVDPSLGGECKNTRGGFECKCAKGYLGSGTASGTGCVDIDECATSKHDCVSTPEGGYCTNSIGSFSCACLPGLAGDGKASGSGCVYQRGAPTFTNANTVTIFVGTPVDFTFRSTGTPTPLSVGVSGTLPNGLSFVNHEDGTAELTGTPRQGEGGTYPLEITADNTVGPPVKQAFTLIVNEAVSFTTDTQVTFKVGTTGSFRVRTLGYPVAVLELSGSLPSGVTFVDQGDGTALLAGQPLAATGGVYTLGVTASNSHSQITNTLTLTVEQAPALTNDDSTSFVTEEAGSFTFDPTGYPAISSISYSGQLPNGVDFSYNGKNTATLSGTPSDGEGGSYPLSVLAYNGVTPNALQSFTLIVNEPPDITSMASTYFRAGNNISAIDISNTFTVRSDGYPTPEITLNGSLPNGVQFEENGDGSATLAGTPGTNSGGLYPLEFTAHNGIGSDKVQSFNLYVYESPQITGPSSDTFTVGVADSASFSGTGYPSVYSIGLNGKLPFGVGFTDTGKGTAFVDGTPADGSGGVYPLEVTGYNGISPNGVQPFELTVTESPSFLTSASATFNVGSSANFAFGVDGYPRAAVTLDGELPTGLFFNDPGDGPATLSGNLAQGTGGIYTVDLTAANGVAPNALQTLEITVLEAPRFTNGKAATFVVGEANTFAITSAGYPEVDPIDITAGSLPSGLGFYGNGDGTAEIAGTPAPGSGGSYPIQLTGSNGVSPDATQDITVVVVESLGFTSDDTATFYVCSNGSFAIEATGFPSVNDISVTGTLPDGVTFTYHGNGAASFSGVPTAGSGGSYTLELTAANGGDGTDAVQTFTLFVNEAPVFTSTDDETFRTGESGSFTLAATGYPAAMTFANIGDPLPDGLSLTPQGVLAGTPAAESGGVYELTFSADNGEIPTATQFFTLTVEESPAFTSTASATFAAGQFGSFQVTGTGYPAFSVANIGDSLPDGLSLTSEGLISGTPAAESGGTYALELELDNGIGTPVTQSFTLTVDEAPAFTNVDQATFTAGASESFTLTATGYPTAITFSNIGDPLPNGVSLDAKGLVSGTPAANSGGVYSVTFSADNGVSPSAEQPFTLTVEESPTITSDDATTFTVGQNNTFQVMAGGYPAAFTVTNTGAALPSGVSLTATGQLSGNPAANSGGSYALVFEVSNGVGTAISQSFTLTINEAPAFTNADQATFRAGQSESFTLTASGYPTTYAFANTGDALPTGLSLSSQGVLSGTPGANSGGVYTLTFSADNGVGTAASQSFTLTVEETPVFTSTASATFTAGQFDSFQVTGSGYPAFTVTNTGDALPNGLTLTDQGLISGTAAAASGGTYALTLELDNGVGTAATQSFTLTVNEAPAFTNTDEATFLAGGSATFELTASGYPATITFTNIGDPLPKGLSLSTAGLIDGTPGENAGGVYTLTFSADNGVSPSATQNFTLTVEELPTITSANSTTFGIGQNNSFQVTASGYPDTFTVTNTGDALPSGVTLSSTGELSGDPAANTAGTYALVFEVGNGIGTPDTQNFTLTVSAAVTTITSADAATFRVGEAGSFELTSSSNPATATFQFQETLPDGLSITNDGDGTGSLGGTAAAGTGGAYNLTLTASNGSGTDGSQSFTLTIEEAPTFTNAATVTFPKDDPFSFQLAAEGYPETFTFTNTGAPLPSGVTLSGAGVLSGMVANTGTYALEFAASNGIASAATQQFALTIGTPTPAIQGVTPTPVGPGETATIKGLLFDNTPANNTVKIGGLSASVLTATGGNQLEVRVPCIPSGPLPVTVQNSNGTSPTFTATFQNHNVQTLGVGQSFAPNTATASECTELAATGVPSRYMVSVFNVNPSPTASAGYVLSGTSGANVAIDTIDTPPTVTAADTTDVIELPVLELEQRPGDPILPAIEEELDSRHIELLESNAQIVDEFATLPIGTLQGVAPSNQAVAFDPIDPPVSRAFRVPNINMGAFCNNFYALTATRVYFNGKFAIYEDDATPIALRAANNATMQDYYNRIGDQFNNDMEPILRTNFGDPLLRDAQTDNNGVVIMLSTPVINTYFSGVSGFAVTCDQYPNDDGTTNLNKSSNFGEIVYVYQPTGTGAGTATVGTADYWYRTIRATLIHETKHMASYAVRIANGYTLETSWLEESTARLAEELWYRQAIDVLPWKGNHGYGSTDNPVSLYCDVRPDFAECTTNPRRPAVGAQRPFSSLSTFLFGTNGRLLSALGKTPSDTQSYFYATGWSLVRYAIDRYASTEAGFLTALTQSNNTGLTNLLAVAGNGADASELLGGWSIALYSDDYPSFVSPPLETQFQTWNLRSVYSGLNTDFPGTYTLAFPGVGTSYSFGTISPLSVSTMYGGGALLYNLSGTQTASQSVSVRGTGDTTINANTRVRILRVQ